MEVLNMLRQLRTYIQGVESYITCVWCYVCTLKPDHTFSMIYYNECMDKFESTYIAPHTCYATLDVRTKLCLK